MRRLRLDAELVRRGLVPSRTRAAALIVEGRVSVDGQVAQKPARQVDPAQAIEIRLQEADDYVSRGAHKLAGALELLGKNAPRIQGRRCLDAGASTGGFTDVLLRHGAASVVAVDVGYGQLAWKLQVDERVEVRDRTNIRYLKSADINPPVDLVVGDLSFISLSQVLPALVAVAQPEAEFLLLVKPQFEVGRKHLGKGGVVRDPQLHIFAVEKIANRILQMGLEVRAVVASPLPGPAGNIEYFILAGGCQGCAVTDLRAEIVRAVESRPKAGGMADV